MIVTIMVQYQVSQHMDFTFHNGSPNFTSDLNNNGRRKKMLQEPGNQVSQLWHNK